MSELHTVNGPVAGAALNPALSDELGPLPCPQFNLANQHHANMRRLMCDLYARFVAAVAERDSQRADKYQSMTEGLSRVAREVLEDITLYHLSFALEMAMFAHRRAMHEVAE